MYEIVAPHGKYMAKFSMNAITNRKIKYYGETLLNSSL